MEDEKDSALQHSGSLLGRQAELSPATAADYESYSLNVGVPDCSPFSAAQLSVFLSL